MNILFPFVGDSVGGSHRSVIELYKGLATKKDTILFVVLHQDNGPLAKLLKQLQIGYYVLPLSDTPGERPSITHIFLSALKCFIPIRKFLHNHKIDIVHGNDLRINLTWSLFSRLSGAKYIWHQRSLLSPSKLWKVIPLMCDHFIAISKYVYQTKPSTLREEKASLIPNPFETDIFYDKRDERRSLYKKYSIEPSAFIVGYLGRIIAWKNIEQLIRAFAQFHQLHKSARLVIIGVGDDGYQQRLKCLVREVEANDTVYFLGFKQDRLRYLSTFDVLVSPSREEPFGRVLVEAMLQSVPVVASASGGHLEIIKDHQTGLLYTPDKDKHLVDALCHIRDDPRLACVLTTKALHCAREKYPRMKHVELVYNKYRSLFGS